VRGGELSGNGDDPRATEFQGAWRQLRRDGAQMFAAAMPVLAFDRIRYVGEPVAIVVGLNASVGSGCCRESCDRCCGTSSCLDRRARYRR
jgi:hypothetical protein